MRKLIILSYLIALCWQIATAQVVTTLIVNKTPTNKIVNWANDNTIVSFIANNQTQEPFQVIIKTELKLADGTIIGNKDLAKANIFTLSPGNNLYYAKDVIPINIMMFSGTYNNIISNTGKLPEGYYQLTVQLVSPQGYAPVTQPVSKNFLIPSVQLPVLMKPYKGQVLNILEAQTAIIFRWTPKMPRTQELTNYRVQVFEVLSNQQDVQALRANQPLLDVIVKEQTQYIWRPQLSFIDDKHGKKFIWTIQTLDSAEEPVTVINGNQESRSEPIVFFVSTNETQTDEE